MLQTLISLSPQVHEREENSFVEPVLPTFAFSTRSEEFATRDFLDVKGLNKFREHDSLARLTLFTRDPLLFSPSGESGGGGGEVIEMEDTTNTVLPSYLYSIPNPTGNEQKICKKPRQYASV